MVDEGGEGPGDGPTDLWFVVTNVTFSDAARDDQLFDDIARSSIVDVDLLKEGVQQQGSEEFDDGQ